MDEAYTADMVIENILLRWYDVNLSVHRSFSGLILLRITHAVS